jgi:hypothetical protein
MYEVSYSQRAIDELNAMIDRNPTKATEIVECYEKIHSRLEIYPQFGEPLWDLSIANAQFWIACIRPLVVHYVIVEADDPNLRQVMVVRPFTPLPGSGII